MEERPWLKNYPSGIPANIDPDAYPSLVALIVETLNKYGKKPAFACMGKEITFNDVNIYSENFAAYLQSRGLEPGDKIALMMPNMLQYPIALFGALRAGLVVVNTNPLYTPREMEHQFTDSGAKAIVIAENFAANLEKIVHKTSIKTVIVTSIGELLGMFKGSVVNLLVNVQITDAQSNEIKKRLDKALALNPRSITALTLQGKYYNLIFDYDSALKSFAKADSLSPDDGMLQYNLGVTHFEMEQWAKAEMYFQHAVEKSNFLNAHLYLGVLYKNRGDYEKALEKFRYRVANKQGDDDYYAVQAMKGIRECLAALNIPIPN